MTVRPHFDTVVADRIKDELRVGGRELVETLLNDMIAVEVLD